MVDLAVPDDISVAELIRQATAGGEAGYDARWALSHPARGLLKREATLRDAGILDGEQLHLVPEFDGHPHPYVGDVAEETAADTAARAGGQDASVHWLAVAGAAAVAVCASVAAAARYPALPALETSAAVTALLLVVSFAARPGSASRPEVVFACVTPVPAAAAGWAAATAVGAPAGAALAAGLAAAAAAAEAAGRAARPTQPALRTAAVAGSLAAGLLAVIQVIDSLGVSGGGAAAVGVCLAFGALGVAPRLAVEAGGLGRLADGRARSGRAVRRAQLRASAGRTRWLLFALLAGLGAPVAMLAWPLARAGAAGGYLAVASAAALLLRARYFRHPVHMLAVAVPGVATLLITMVVETFTEAGDAVAAATTWVMIASVGVVAFVAPRLGEVGQARLRVWLGRAETVSVLALVPITVAVSNGYAWVTRIG
jgi:type VII secretion integral membrane protein EccD